MVFPVLIYRKKYLIKYVYMVFTLPYQKIQPFHVHVHWNKTTALSDCLLQKWKQVSTKKCLKINLSCKRNFYIPKISLKIYLPNILSIKFSTNRFKRETSTKKSEEEKSLPNKNQIEISANNFLTTQFLLKLLKEKSLPPSNTKKSLPNKISLVEVSFEIVLVKGSSQHFLSRIYLPKLFGRGGSLDFFWWIMSQHLFVKQFLSDILPRISLGKKNWFRVSWFVLLDVYLHIFLVNVFSGQNAAPFGMNEMCLKLWLGKGFVHLNVVQDFVHQQYYLKRDLGGDFFSEKSWYRTAPPQNWSSEIFW